jgi:hypothetical protein
MPAVHAFPVLCGDERPDSPVKVPGGGRGGKLTGARYPTYDAIVPVTIPQ